MNENDFEYHHDNYLEKADPLLGLAWNFNEFEVQQLLRREPKKKVITVSDHTRNPNVRTRFIGILNFIRSLGAVFDQYALADTDVVFQRNVFDCVRHGAKNERGVSFAVDGARHYKFSYDEGR